MRFGGKQKLPLRELMAQQYLASMTLFDLSMHDFCLLYVYWRFFITCSFSFAKVVYIKFAEKDRSPECSSWWVGFLPYGLYQRSLLIFGPMSRMECLDISKHNWLSRLVDTRPKLNVYDTFRRRAGRLLNVVCTLNLRLVFWGYINEINFC